MYGYGYKINSGLVVGAGGGGGGFTNTYSTSFDGVDDYVHLGDDNSDLQPTGAFSLSVWVKFDSLTGIQGIWEATSTGGGGNNGYVLWKSSANKFQFYMREGGVWKIASATTTVTTGTWYHILCTWDGSSTSKIFVNGTEEGSQSVSSINYNITTTINLGGYQSESISKPYQIDGNIDEASLFHSEISIGDVWDGSGSPTDLSLLPTPPVAWYRNGDNGSYKSPQWLIPSNENKDKVSNYSFQFDGVDDFIDIGNAISFEYNDTFSYSFWINPDSDSGVKYLFSKYASSRGILIYLNSSSSSGNNTLNFNIYNKGSGTPSGRKYITTNSTNMALPNEWTNIVITYDGSGLGSGISFYKNGVAQSVTVTNDSLASNTIVTSQDAYISGNNFASSFYPGKQDEWAIFNTELSSADALAIYNSGEPTTLPSGAVAHYKMGEDATFSGGVWTVPDSAGSNNGTSNGMTIEDRVGDAPNSTSNALSYNMDEVDRVEDTP